VEPTVMAGKQLVVILLPVIIPLPAILFGLVPRRIYAISCAVY
jgi:hypothetical protein